MAFTGVGCGMPRRVEGADVTGFLLHERKLARALRAEARPAHPEEVQQHLGVAPGSVGPVGVRGAAHHRRRVAARGRATWSGANREGFHLTAVAPGSDFACEFADLQVALAGEGCPSAASRCAIERVIEVGNIFKLGTKYSVPLGATYLDERGQQQPIVMGSLRHRPRPDRRRPRSSSATTPTASSGPGPSRRSTCTWCRSAVKDAAQMAAAEEIYRRSSGGRLRRALDDRDERAGVKFKDADLLGIPIRVTVGNAPRQGGRGRDQRPPRAPGRDRRVPRAEVVATRPRRLARTIS